MGLFKLQFRIGQVAQYAARYSYEDDSMQRGRRRSATARLVHASRVCPGLSLEDASIRAADSTE